MPHFRHSFVLDCSLEVELLCSVMFYLKVPRFPVVIMLLFYMYSEQSNQVTDIYKTPIWMHIDNTIQERVTYMYSFTDDDPEESKRGAILRCSTSTQMQWYRFVYTELLCWR
jgi:hypothetical protein